MVQLMIYQILEWSCMIGGFAAFFYKLPDLLRAKKDPAVVALSVYFLCSALSFLVGLDAIWPHIAAFFNYRNITTILVHVLVVILTVAQQIVLMYWSHQPAEAKRRAQRRALAFGIMLAVLILVFIMAMPTRRHGAETASLLNIQNPSYAAYLCLYIATVAVGQIETLRLSLRFGAMVDRSWLRRGMHIVAAGAGFILGYCAMRYAEIIGVHLGYDMEPWDPVQWLAGDIGSLLELIGWTIPSLGVQLAAAARWTGDYRSYLRLRPLWLALYQAVPTIALEPARSRFADLLLPRDLEHRLYRRVIEIRDGQLALRSYFSPAIASLARDHTVAAGLTGDQQQVAIESILLHGALRAKELNAPPAETPLPPMPDGSVDLQSETAWLTRVAAEFTRVDRELGAMLDAAQGSGK